MQNKSFSSNLFRGIASRARKLFHNPYGQVNIDPVRLKYYKHLPKGGIRKHAMLNGTVHFYSAQELLHGLKELFVEELYRVQLPPRPYIIDCGANIGLSIIYLKQQHPDAEILAFEPDARNFDLLSRTISSYHFAEVQLRNEAVWKENTTLSFAGAGSMSSRIDETATGSKVKAVRLRDFLDRKVDFLKIDIEGAEYEVLRDIQDRLQMVDHLFLEYHGSFSQNKELLEMLGILVEKGFHFYIKEAASVYDHPFLPEKQPGVAYDVQLNIFCSRSAAS